MSAALPVRGLTPLGRFRLVRETQVVFVLHKGDVDEEWHEFLVTGRARDGALCVLTCDEDHYMLSFEDVADIHGREPGGRIPAAVSAHGGALVRFGLRHSAAARDRIRREARDIVEEYEGSLPFEGGARVSRAAVGGGFENVDEEPASEVGEETALVESRPREDREWIALEPLGGLSLGQPVTLLEGDLVTGDHGLVLRSGSWVKVQRVSVPEVPAVVAGCRARFASWAGDVATTSEVGGDIRTLAVDYDGQGERHKSWRALCSELHFSEVDSSPVEGPPSAIYVCKHMERHGLTPKGWLELFIRDKGLNNADRVVHELRVLVEILELGGCVDQLNLGSLACFEFLCRRVQAIVDAHAVNPQKPNYESASLFCGLPRPSDNVAPELRSYVARKARDEAEVEKQRQKVRELRAGKSAGAPAAK